MTLPIYTTWKLLYCTSFSNFMRSSEHWVDPSHRFTSKCDSERSSRGGPEWKAGQYLFRIICFGLRKWVWKDAVTLFFIVALGMSQHRHGTPLRDTRTSNFGQYKCSLYVVFFLALVRDWKRFVTSPAQWVHPWEPTIWSNFFRALGSSFSRCPIRRRLYKIWSRFLGNRL